MFGLMGVARMAGQPGAGFTYYVDSVSGSDANAGTSPAQALQTIAAVPTLTAGQSIGLARGSHWREQYNVPANNVTIGVYGTGDMPVIDGADVVTTGWTQPDAMTYPNVWSRSWTRSSATTTGSEYLGYWEAGARTTRQTSLANLQAGSNGHWHTTSLTTQTSTVSIRAAADPNSDGILREITKRHHAINSQTGALRTGVNIVGPIEAKRCVGHENALSMGTTGASKMLLRDGHVHHLVAQADLLADIIATEVSPDYVGPVPFAAYRPDGTGYSPVFRRCMALLPGGASRPDAGNGFYAHADTSLDLDSLTLDQCAVRGLGLGSADAGVVTILNCYSEDPFTYSIIAAGAVTNVVRTMVLDRSTAPGSSNGLLTRGAPAAATFTLTDVCSYTTKNRTISNTGTGGTKPVLRTSSIIGIGQGIIHGELDIEYCVIGQTNGYMLDQLTTLYVGDFNIYTRTVADGSYFHWDGTGYFSLGAFQAASGQDANSVDTLLIDQTSGNQYALWKGVQEGINNGPPDGDFRINPGARVYNGAGTAFIGTFADGVTPITAAGAQSHWNYNTRAIVAGPPSRYPALPASIAEMRTYVEDPSAWDFYP